MKCNFTENQYEQLAREQFCKTLYAIPFVSDIEIVPADSQRGFGDFYAIVHFTDQKESIRFCVEVKANGEKRFVNMFIDRTSQYSDEICNVFMAPYFSAESAEVMKNQKCSYMDLSGNCYILSKRIFIHVSGQTNKYVDKREKKNYFSKSSEAASVIMRTMLDNPADKWQVKALAERTGKAIGTVSNVKKFLLDRAWIQEGQRWFELCNVKEMLYAWARDYHKKDSRFYEFYSLNTISEMEREIAYWTMRHDHSAVLGGFSAAARYAPTVRYKKVNVYVEQQCFDEFVCDMDLQPVNSGGNVIITIPHDETPCMFSRIIDDALVTSPVQTILDLLGNAGRGEEAADAIIAKVYEGR